MPVGSYILTGNPPAGSDFTWHYCDCGYGEWAHRKPSRCPQETSRPGPHQMHTGMTEDEYWQKEI